MLEYVLNSTIRNRAPQRVLFIHSGAEAQPEIDTSMVRMKVSCGPGVKAHGHHVICDTEVLPFTGESFQVVVINGLVRKGNEDIIEEARRVLGSRGLLVILGRGQLGRSDATALNPFSVCRRIKERKFMIKQCEGFGFWGRAVRLGRKWQKPLLMFSDQILITGQLERIKPVVTHLRFNQPQAAGAQSAALDTLRRQSQ